MASQHPILASQTINQDLLLDSHIKQISKTSSFPSYTKLPVSEKSYPFQDAGTLIHAFITSRRDYCNALRSGFSNNSIKSLQLIQNAAAHIHTNTHRQTDHSVIYHTVLA